MKILILVANSNFYPSNIMIPFLRKTWGKDKRVRVIYYQGGSKDDYLKGDKLYLNAGTTIDDTMEKVLSAYEWVNQNIEFDYIFRTTTSSYLDIENFISFLNKNKNEKLYSGVYLPHAIVNNEVEKIRFLSGAGFFTSKYIVNLLLSNKKKLLKYGLWDDVSIGKFLIEEMKIPINEGYRQDFYDGYPLTKKIKTENYHYRLASKLLYYPRYLEVLTLLSLHFRMNSLKNNRKSLLSLFRLSDIFFVIIYEILRYLNPRLIILNLRKLNKEKNKLIVAIIKSNQITLRLFKKIKKITKFKNFK